jgi:hypothetical protein
VEKPLVILSIIIGGEEEMVIWIEIDTWVIKNMVLGAKGEDEMSGRRGVRCGDYRVIGP